MELTRENVLIEALPYIREFYGSVVVIKLGGHVMDNEAMMDSVARDIVLLRYVGIHPIAIHGGGVEISQIMEKMGKEPKFVAGLRITDEETLEIARMVLLGNINQKLVSMIGKHGAKGLGLSGGDVRLVIAKKKDPILVKKKEVDLGWVGEIEKINPEILMIASEKGFIPIVAPIAVDDAGHSFNVNADEVAGSIAMAVKAKKLIMLTDVQGLLKNPSDPSSLVPRLSYAEAKELIDKGIIKGGMIPKISGCMKAIDGGVESAHIINGMHPHSILLELFTKLGIGTMIHKMNNKV